MAKFTTVSSDHLNQVGRLDAQFVVLLEEHRPLYEELMTKFTRQELVALAKALPYSDKAARAVCVAMSGGTFERRRGESYFHEWLDAIEANKSLIPRKHSDVAAYCAAAACGARLAIMEEVLELARKKLETIERLVALVDAARDKGATILGQVLAQKREGKPSS